MDARRRQGHRLLKLDPANCRHWYDTPLGRRVDADEKEVVFGLADLSRGERVLDVGCGDGNYTGPAAGRTGSAVGLDRSPEMLQAAERRLRAVPGIRWVEGDATKLPFLDASFDAVLIVTVLCFARDPEPVVREAFRVLRPGGRLVLGELGRYSSWAFIRRLRGWAGSRTWRNAHFFDPRELRTVLRRAGLVELSESAAVFYPPLRHQAFSETLGRLERLGRRWCPWAGALIVVRGHHP